MKFLKKIAIAFWCIGVPVTSATTIVFKGTFEENNTLSNKCLHSHYSSPITEVIVNGALQNSDSVGVNCIVNGYQLTNEIKFENCYTSNVVNSKNEIPEHSQPRELNLSQFNNYNTSKNLNFTHFDTSKAIDKLCISECLNNLFQSKKYAENVTFEQHAQCHLCEIF